MEIVDLRAICAGYDKSLVEAVGGEFLLSEGANIQAIKIQLSDLAKDAKDDMNEAKKLAKTDRAAAVKKYDSAISKLKKLKKECENIEDDHLVMVFIDTYIRTFIPVFCGTVAAFLVPGAATGIYLTGIVTGFCCGIQKSLDFSTALEKKIVKGNKAGPNGEYDPKNYWKVGETRGATMLQFDRLITACEKAKSEIK